MAKIYFYKVVREEWNGKQGKRARTYRSFTDRLKVGGLYTQLGKGFPGMQRVIGMTVEEAPD